jgi:hypothetical protein
MISVKKSLVVLSPMNRNGRWNGDSRKGYRRGRGERKGIKDEREREEGRERRERVGRRG